MDSPSSPSASPWRAGLRLHVWLGVIVAVGGCVRQDPAEVTQAVARVNKDEITEQQVNQVLERQRGIRPDQLEAASQRAVVALVDQEILMQKARELKLDRDAKVVSGLEAAKRELVSRAYVERIADGVAVATPDEVRAYYEGKPALFKDRLVYSLQELAVQATPAQRTEIETRVRSLSSPAELDAYLKAGGFQVRGERSTVPAENLPFALLEKLATVKPGRGIVIPAADGLRIVLVMATESAPVSLQQARPAIEAFIGNERKRAAIDREMQSLRAAASIEYLGKYKSMAASAPAAAASAPIDEATANKGLAGLR